MIGGLQTQRGDFGKSERRAKKKAGDVRAGEAGEAGRAGEGRAGAAGEAGEKQTGSPLLTSEVNLLTSEVN